jgi:cytochrome c-type biogenesis protein CcmH
MVFWIVSGALALVVSVMIGLTLMRGRVGDKPPAAYDLQVYRDQLKEVDRDLARGVIGTEDAERMRAEISRRVLTADAQLQQGGETGGQPGRGGLIVAMGLGALLAAGSVWVYTEIGAPGYRDLPLKTRIAESDAARANRLSQSEAESRMPPASINPNATEQFLTLMEQLRETVKNRPDDLRGLTLLARNEAGLGDYVAAYAAQNRIIEVKGEEAVASDYAYLAELMISAAGGYVSSEAEAALRAALERDPRNAPARYYLGLYLMQVDRPDAAFRTWDALLRESRADAPWVAPIRERIEEVAWRAGETEYTLPPLEGAAPAPGPTAEDMAAAQDMTPEERQQMIRGMVTGLSERLANEGGTAEEWARLIRALGVLGDTDQARAIWSEAQALFAQTPEDMAIVQDAAEAAGVAQ